MAQAYAFGVGRAYVGAAAGSAYAFRRFVAARKVMAKPPYKVDRPRLSSDCQKGITLLLRQTLEQKSAGKLDKSNKERIWQGQKGRLSIRQVSS